MVVTENEHAWTLIVVYVRLSTIALRRFRRLSYSKYEVDITPALPSSIAPIILSEVANSMRVVNT